jgi:hypothetical protein
MWGSIWGQVIRVRCVCVTTHVYQGSVCLAGVWLLACGWSAGVLLHMQQQTPLAISNKQCDKGAHIWPFCVPPVVRTCCATMLVTW